MTHVTGLLLIDAPASALNNLGQIEGERYDNSTGVKVIRANDGPYPYVSAQAFRYWLRQTLSADPKWKAAPIYREEKIAYTDANPIEWWDDDLFGYMRAPSKRESAKAKREADTSRQGETETTDTVTRVAPFRVSTLVSIAPIRPTSDFGVMSRHEGNPVPHEHQFYRTTLKGLFSLNLRQCGAFSYKQKTGFRNLDEVRIKAAEEKGLKPDKDNKVYRLPANERLERVTTLFEGFARLEGGAKQALHYTDVAPTVVVLGVTKGGNHIFGHVIGANSEGLPEFNTDALTESFRVFGDDLLSNVYVGWVTGYMDKEREKVVAFAEKEKRVKVSHPREAFQALIADLKQTPQWLD
ncbi:MAG: type I-B CRISPR-associated protein Cas7/Cst2/DevR [Chloroflexota bacterium]